MQWEKVPPANKSKTFGSSENSKYFLRLFSAIIVMLQLIRNIKDNLIIHEMRFCQAGMMTNEFWFCQRFAHFWAVTVGHNVNCELYNGKEGLYHPGWKWSNTQFCMPQGWIGKIQVYYDNPLDKWSHYQLSHGYALADHLNR